MKFIMNENIPATVIRTLRERGHDVCSVKESMRAAPDEEVLRRAQIEQRVVVTNDKGFGELAFKFGLLASCGIILFRLSGSSREADNQRIIEVLEAREDWIGHFAVVTDDRTRMRPLPQPGRGVLWLDRNGNRGMKS
jgi:predicted nuclease of predicted toxin-antitoxin system